MTIPHRAALLAACFILPAPALAGVPINAPADVAAITALETGNANAMDAKALVAAYAPDAVVYDLGVQGVYKGRAQILAGFAPQLAAVKSIHATLPELTILSDGGMACAASQIHFDGVTKTGGTLALNLRQLDILRKINGKWLIEEEDASFPVDLAADKPLMTYSIAAPGPIDWGQNPLPGPRLSSAAAKAGIRAWLQDFATAPNLKAALALTGPGDAEIFFDMFAPGALHGAQAIAEAVGPGFAPVQNIAASFTDFRADTDGLLGGEIDTQILTIHLKTGSMVKWRLREADCLRNVNGHWYTAMDELSFPVDLRTGRAVINP